MLLVVKWQALCSHYPKTDISMFLIWLFFIQVSTVWAQKRNSYFLTAIVLLNGDTASKLLCTHPLCTKRFGVYGVGCVLSTDQATPEEHRDSNLGRYLCAMLPLPQQSTNVELRCAWVQTCISTRAGQTDPNRWKNFNILLENDFSKPRLSAVSVTLHHFVCTFFSN